MDPQRKTESRRRRTLRQLWSAVNQTVLGSIHPGEPDDSDFEILFALLVYAKAIFIDKNGPHRREGRRTHAIISSGLRPGAADAVRPRRNLSDSPTGSACLVNSATLPAATRSFRGTQGKMAATAESGPVCRGDRRVRLFRVALGGMGLDRRGDHWRGLPSSQMAAEPWDQRLDRRAQREVLRTDRCYKRVSAWPPGRE
jgi:hypothetical protein